MNKQEMREMNAQFFDVYCGMRFNASQLAAGGPVTLEYRFNCPEFAQLKEQYPIEKVAGKGGDFERALRLCRWLAPRLKHKSDYDNHVPCNSLALLEYCFEKDDVGINCLNKAKILAECCLALGIYARRVRILPASPYDGDNHVVTEIFDRRRDQWIALDPTTGGYFSAGGAPLSCLELRNAFAEHAPVSVVLNRQNPAKLAELCTRNIELNAYYAKNSFYFTFDTVSTFGIPEDSARVYVVPQGFDVHRALVRNLTYGLELYRGQVPDATLREMEERIHQVQNDPPRLASPDLWDSPLA